MTTKMQSCEKAPIALIPAFTQVRSSLLQRKCACGGTPGPSGECEACRGKRLERVADNSPIQPEGWVAPPLVHDVLRSPGQPLDPATRAFAEPRFGHDFSQVRVHTGEPAGESARAVNALAYTVGQDVVFAPGYYRPHAADGRSLISHELAHVVQQSGTHRRDGDITMGEVNSPAEREADIAAEAANALAFTVDRDVIFGSGQYFPAAKARQQLLAHELTHAVQQSDHGDASRTLRRQPASPETSTSAVLLRQLASRPRLALQRWGKLSPSERDQVLSNMMSRYGVPFSSEFLKYAKNEKKPRFEGGVLKGFEYTPKWLSDRGYRHAYDELWVHPSGEEITLLAPRAKAAAPEPEDDIAKRCPGAETCFSDSEEQDGCRKCCAETFAEVDSECRRHCESRCNDKL